MRADGTRQLLTFTQSRGESQGGVGGPTHGVVSAWAGRPPELQLIVTDGCAGLAAAPAGGLSSHGASTVWGAQLRNVLTMVRRQDHAAVKADAQAIYQAASRREAEALAQQFGRRWQATYPKKWSPACCGIVPNCWPSSAVHACSGDGCGRPTASNAASWKSGSGHARWSVSSTSRASSGLSIRSLTGSI